MEFKHRLFRCGDTHGNEARDAEKLYKKQFKESKELSKTDYLIVLGDFGFFWETEKNPDTAVKRRIRVEKKWHKILTSQSFTTLFLDGNHENFDIINEFPEIDFHGGKAGLGYEDDNGKIIHLKRGEVYIINGLKIFVCGGARSNDIESRKEGITWWPQETLSEEEKANAIKNLEKHNWEVDYVLTHQCPKSVGMEIAVMEAGGAYNYSSSRFDRLAHKASCPVAEFFEELLEKGLKAKEWYFGHWHLRNDFRTVKNGITIQSHYKNPPEEFGV